MWPEWSIALGGVALVLVGGWYVWRRHLSRRAISRFCKQHGFVESGEAVPASFLDSELGAPVSGEDEIVRAFSDVTVCGVRGPVRLIRVRVVQGQAGVVRSYDVYGFLATLSSQRTPYNCEILSDRSVWVPNWRPGSRKVGLVIGAWLRDRLDRCDCARQQKQSWNGVNALSVIQGRHTLIVFCRPRVAGSVSLNGLQLAWHALNLVVTGRKGAV